MVMLTQRKIFTARDFIVIFCMFVFFLSFYFFAVWRKGERYAEISVNGQVEAVIPFSGETVYMPDGLPGVKISVSSGGAGVIQSDCPDKICVRAGMLSIPGQAAVCLPNRVIVRVTTRSPGESDMLDGVLY
jgi:hypothetical protein